jgi:hypothetical protein
MDVDFTLSSVFHSCGTPKQVEVDIVKYMCNLSFSDVLDPCENVKFPGTMVVSLGMEDIKRVVGIPMVHKPYKLEEIAAWLNPCTLQIPPLHFQRYGVSNSLMRSRQKKMRFNTNNIDFGDQLGLFEFVPHVFIDLNCVDFGSSDGCFEVFDLV